MADESPKTRSGLAFWAPMIAASLALFIVVVDSIERIDISGGADLEGSGNVAGYSLSASGGADADLADLIAVDVDVDVSGGADARIFASGSVEGDASGGADLTVLGDPAQSRVDTSGGADVDFES